MKSLILFCILSGLGYLSAQPQIIAAEWFIDQDPGIGQATPFASFTPDTTVQLSASLSGITPGLHKWYARVLNSNGHWSHTYGRNFLVWPRDTISPIHYLEWFWDTDPGFGQANVVPGVQGDSISATWAIDLAGIPPGIHDLYIRTRNEAGIWSHTYRRSTIIRAQPDAMISSFDYYYRDPSGQTADFTYTLTQPMHYVDLQFDPDTSTLIDQETYDLCIAAIRTDGKQSFERCTSFTWTSNPSVGLSEMSEDYYFALYPNPNMGQFTITLPETRTHPVFFRMVNGQGQTVSERIIPPSGTHEVAIHHSHLSSGMYFVIIEAENLVSIKKVMVR